VTATPRATRQASTSWSPTAPRASLHLGLDIGGTETQAVIVNDTLAPLCEASTPTQPGPAGVIATIVTVTGLLGVDLARVDSIGIGIPGLVDHRTGRVRQAVNIGLVDLDLAAALTPRVNCQVRVDNDVKATALGAAHSLTTASPDLVYLNVGTGIALAAVAGGELIRGRDNIAGEIGHLVLDPAGDLCRCGQRGCLETLAAGWAVSQRLDRVGLDLTQVAIDPSPEAAAECQRIVHGIATAVGLAALSFDPATILLGGGVIRTASGLIDRIVARLAEQEAASDFLAHLALSHRVVQVPPGSPIGAIGAAAVGWPGRLPDPTSTH
jgi:predicted NBD/HSP70 family sugar kinase